MKLDIDVLVTCFNKEKYLDEAITSILNQSKQPRNIILVHDGCDNPQSHVHATTIILPENKGVANAREHGFRHSQASLVLFFDGDDVLAPDYLEKMALTIHSGADVAYPNTYLWFEDLDAREILTPPNKLNSSFLTKMLNMKRTFLPVTCLMKREVFESLQGFGNYPVFEDWEFWLRALSKGFVFKKANTLLSYRRSGATRNHASSDIRKKVFQEVVKRFQIKNGAVHAQI